MNKAILSLNPNGAKVGAIESIAVHPFSVRKITYETQAVRKNIRKFQIIPRITMPMNTFIMPSLCLEQKPDQAWERLMPIPP